MTSKRNLQLDNLKFILIALVIIGHTIEPVIGRYDWVESIYIFIYLFHMPMFVYASGVVSSKYLDDAIIRRIVVRLIIPYVLLELCYSLFDYYIFSRNTLTISPLAPYWIMWYMLSLIFWRMLLPVFNQFRYPVILGLVLGFGCGLYGYDYHLSFSRTFVFLPFFSSTGALDLLLYS